MKGYVRKRRVFHRNRVPLSGNKSGFGGTVNDFADIAQGCYGNKVIAHVNVNVRGRNLQAYSQSRSH